jgi:hypothetical protein
MSAAAREIIFLVFISTLFRLGIREGMPLWCYLPPLRPPPPDEPPEDEPPRPE